MGYRCIGLGLTHMNEDSLLGRSINRLNSKRKKLSQAKVTGYFENAFVSI